MRLVITADSEEVPDSDLAFVVDEELQTHSMDEKEAIFGTFVKADVADTTGLPLYEIFCSRFVDNTRRAYNMPELIMLYRDLEETIQDRDITTIESRVSDDSVNCVVYDLSQEYPVETNIQSSPATAPSLVWYCVLVAGIVPFLLDQVLSLLFPPGSESTDVVVVPSFGRFDSIKSVLAAAEFEYELVITPMTLSWLKQRGQKEEMARFCPTPFNIFLTLSTFVKELQFLVVALPRELVVNRQLERGVRQQVASEFDVEMPQTVTHLVVDPISSSLLRDFSYYYLTHDAVDRLDASTFVVGSGAPKGRAMLAAAARHGCELYHVPHSMARANHEGAWFGSTVITDGEMASTHYEQLDFIDADSHEPLGRPYFRNLIETVEGASNDSTADSRTEILIATMLYNDQTRLCFVENTIQAIQASDLDADITIKVHPNESVDFYDEIAAEYGVTVADDALYSRLSSADIAVTIRSNVGFEAVFADCMSICVNLWEPLIWTPLYARDTPIPALKSTAQLHEFFRQLSPADINCLRTEQKRFAENAVITSETVDEDIAREIAP